MIWIQVKHYFYIVNFLCCSPVGNKNDAPDRKVVLTEDAQRFADQMNIQLFETSAKDNINVEEVCLLPLLAFNEYLKLWCSVSIISSIS